MKTITDKNKAFSALKHSITGYVMKNFSPELRDDANIVMHAVSSHGYALQFASPRLSNNQEIVRQAVAKNCLAFKYAGEELKNNSFFILSNLDSNINAAEIFKYCSDQLQNDIEFAKNFLKINAFGLKYFPTTFKANKDIALLALETNELAFKFIKKEIRDDPEITKRALAIPYNFKYIAKKYKADESMFLLAAFNLQDETFHPEFECIGENLKTNKNLFKKIIKTHPTLFQYASSHLKNDCELLRVVLEKLGKKVEHTYCNSKELISPYIKNHAYYLIYASDNILNDREIILDVLKKDSLNIRYASEEIQNMLGTNKKEYVSRLEKIISSESLVKKLDDNLITKDTRIKKIKI